MSHLLPAWPLLSAFVVASLILAISPGPVVLYIVTRSLVQGRRAGLASVAGAALGNLGNATAAALGLAALFAVSSVAFTVVKYAGALYLVYLGIRLLHAPAATSDEANTVAQTLAQDRTPWRRVMRDGFLVALLNPKTTVFYAAFLPQLLEPGPHHLIQSLTLGALFVLIAASTDSLYALAAGSLAPWLRGPSSRRLGQRLGGGAFVGLGVFAALSGTRGVA